MSNGYTEEWLKDYQAERGLRIDISDAPKRNETRMRQFVVDLPLPPQECSPNARVHWGKKARAARLYREACGYLAVKQLGRRRVKGRVTIDLDFYLARPKVPDGLCRPLDEDNAIACAKVSLDSLRDAGLISNDSKKHVRIGQVNLYSTKREHQGRSGLVLRIREESAT